MKRQPQRLSRQWWKQKTFAWTTRKTLGLLNTSSPPSCILYLSVCAVHLGNHDLSVTPLLSPQSTLPLHVPRASWGKCPVYWWMHMAMGKRKTNTGSLWPEHTHAYKRMHTDAQSYTAPLKYVAVYMYSISTMYSLRCCTLHVDL